MTTVGARPTVTHDGESITSSTTTAPPRTVLPARTPPSDEQARRRLGVLRTTDLLAVFGALAASLTMTGLLWTQLAPFTGPLGYIVTTWCLFILIYGVLVSFDESRPTMWDRVAAVVVQSLGALIVSVLIFVVIYTFYRGWKALVHVNFFTQDLRSTGPLDPLTKGGVVHAALGTLIEVGIALGISVPLGLLGAVFLHEIPGRFSRFVRTVVEAMTALPDILAGLFIYATLILILGLDQSGLAAATALSVTILPIIIRAADVVLRLVPGNLTEASHALGTGQWRTVWHVTLPTAGNVSQYGMVVNYAPVGSSTGRAQFKQGSVQWAASDIPYGVRDGTNTDTPPTRGFAYMPDTAGGTVFMYNLKIGNRRVTNLRLSGDNIAKIFTGVITKWNDPAIATDNPGLTLPAIKIVPVVRSDGSGSTAQLTQWMVAREGSFWTSYCTKVGRSPCTQTSAYPVVPGSGMVAQSGDLGVAGYVAQQQAVGTIGYVEYSYAIQAGFPVAKMLNAAGYYTEPTAGHVAVALLKAKINTDQSNRDVYLTQDLSGVYVNPDRRTYPLSSYSYLILPTDTSVINTNQGNTLGDFGKYLLCQEQNQVDALGYSALPINLVQAGFDQLKKIPGANIPNINIKSCNNPTFSTNGTNTLAATDPFPAACDKKGPTQCATGTGGAKSQTTPINPSTEGNNGGGSGGGGTAVSNAAGGSVGTGGTSGNTTGAGGGGATATTASGGPATAKKSTSRAASAQAAACDPDSGTCPANGGGATTDSTGQDVAAKPTSTSASLGDGLQVTLMALAAALLLGLGLAPPLIAQLSARRRDRRGAAR